MAPQRVHSILSLPSALVSLTLALTASTVAAAAGDQCFWRSSNVIRAEDSGWFACNNTQVASGGAQLCCIDGSSCGEDSLCHVDNGGSSRDEYYVGGCTDGTYEDGVCRSSCTGDAQTWVQWNTSSSLWHCCGDNGCTGTPTSETFNAIAPAQWSAVPSVQSRVASATSSATSSATRRPTASAKPPSHDSLSTGAIAGIGVAAGVAGIALIAAVVFLVLWKKRRDKQWTKPDYDARWQQDREMMQSPQLRTSPYYGAGGLYQPQDRYSPLNSGFDPSLAADGAAHSLKDHQATSPQELSAAVGPNSPTGLQELGDTEVYKIALPDAVAEEPK